MSTTVVVLVVVVDAAPSMRGRKCEYWIRNYQTMLEEIGAEKEGEAIAALRIGGLNRYVHHNQTDENACTPRTVTPLHPHPISLGTNSD